MRKRKQYYFFISFFLLIGCLVLIFYYIDTLDNIAATPSVSSYSSYESSSGETEPFCDDSNSVNYTLETINNDLIRSDEDFVLITDYIPDVAIDLKYSTLDNFTGSVIYNFSDAYLRYGTVKKLSKVQADLRKMNMGLKIWDAYRPIDAQYELWRACPNSTYVSNPNKGYSSHSRGNTVDITLIYSDGTEVQMPTGFDNFTSKADRDYSDCSQVEKKNAQLLESVMQSNGFRPYYGEWWHFSDSISYEVEKNFYP